MQVRVKRAKDLPVITKITTSGYDKEFPAEQQEFILDQDELAIV
jgi:hypothetical protein